MRWSRRRASVETDGCIAAAPSWVALPATLDAVAAAPGDPVARERLAVHLAGLAMLQPPLRRNARGLLPGFLRRPDVDQLQDCRITKRALLELGPLLDGPDAPHAALRAAGLDVADLHGLRGVLYEGLYRVDLAVDECERAAALVPWERQNAIDRANAFRHKAAMLRAEIALRPGPGPDDVRQIQEVAARIGARITNLVNFDPERWMVHAAEPTDLVWCAAFRARLEEARSLAGFRELCWLESADFTERWGYRSVSAVFGDDRGTIVAVSGSHKAQVVDVQTLLSDGTIVSVVPNRGTTHFEAGPWIDALHVDPIPVRDALAIQGGLVRLNLSRRPGTGVVPIVDLPGVLDVLDRERQLKLAFRLAEGLTEIEVRGTGYGDPDLAMYPAQAAARAAIAAAQAEHAARAAA